MKNASKKDTHTFFYTATQLFGLQERDSLDSPISTDSVDAGVPPTRPLSSPGGEVVKKILMLASGFSSHQP